MSSILNSSPRLCVVAVAVAAGGWSFAAIAEPIDLWLPRNAPVQGPTSYSQTFNGVTVTARGYVAEFDTAAQTSAILGPFPTTNAGASDHQIFGPGTLHSGIPASSSGLGLFVAPSPGINPAALDYAPTSATILPYIDSSFIADNPDVPGPAKPKMDLVMLSFDQPVDVAAFTTNTANDWWAAGWTSEPNLDSGLEAALSSAEAIKVRDFSSLADNDFFTHSTGFQAISFMAVAYPPPVDGFGLRPFRPLGQFSLIGLDAVPAIPEPSTYALLFAGLSVLGMIARRRRRLDLEHGE